MTIKITKFPSNIFQKLIKIISMDFTMGLWFETDFEKFMNSVPVLFCRFIFESSMAK